MKKQQYLSALLNQDVNWIKASADLPSAGMTRVHVALHHIAIRKLQGKKKAAR